MDGGSEMVPRSGIIDQAATRETDLHSWFTGLKGTLWLVFWEMMLIWEGNKLESKRYTHKPVSPLIGSEAPCCGTWWTISVY